MEHKKVVEKYNGSLKELARDIGDLHYESLQELFHEISQKLLMDAVKDRQSDRPKLGKELSSAAANLEYGSQAIERAWEISKPFMK